MRKLFYSVICICVFISCNSNYSSRKKGYFNVPFPEHRYLRFQQSDFPYAFDYPVYAHIIRDSNYLDAVPENDYWMNVDFPQYNAKFFLSYKIIGGKSILKVKQADGKYRDSIVINSFDNLVNDAFNLTNKNDVAATAISDSLFVNSQNISGIFFKVGGNAATSRQFFLSDTSTHFLRGALYFDATPNADSLKPMLDFLEKDMKHLMQTLQWQKQ